jgi:hypothetical protein
MQIWDASEWNDAEGDGLPDRVLTEEAAGTKMFVADGSDYRAALLTAEDFNCAHFEPPQEQPSCASQS